jgi:hypothetical protein
MHKRARLGPSDAEFRDAMQRTLDRFDVRLDALPLGRHDASGRAQCIVTGSAVLEALVCAVQKPKSQQKSQPSACAPWRANDVDLFVTRREADAVRAALERDCNLELKYTFNAGEASSAYGSWSELQSVEMWATKATKATKETKATKATKASTPPAASFITARHHRDHKNENDYEQKGERPLSTPYIQLIVVDAESTCGVIADFDHSIVRNTFDGTTLHVTDARGIAQRRSQLAVREAAILSAFCRQYDSHAVESSARINQLVIKHWPGDGLYRVARAVANDETNHAANAGGRDYAGNRKGYFPGAQVHLAEYFVVKILRRVHKYVTRGFSIHTAQSELSVARDACVVGELTAAVHRRIGMPRVLANIIRAYATEGDAAADVARWVDFAAWYARASAASHSGNDLAGTVSRACYFVGRNCYTADDDSVMAARHDASWICPVAVEKLPEKWSNDWSKKQDENAERWRVHMRDLVDDLKARDVRVNGV